MNETRPAISTRFEVPGKVTKLLVYCIDPRIIAYELGKYGVFLEHYRVIRTKPKPQYCDPVLVTVRYDTIEDVLSFIQTSQLRAIRLFKTARYKYKVPVGFLFGTARNLLGLLNNKHGSVTIKISSHDRKIRDQFYNIALEINEEFSYGHRFDFDEYDIDFVLKEYNGMVHKELITYFYGPGYPNIRL